jgi:hypothetical protein
VNIYCRCGSVVEHSIRNRAVAGSNPAIGFPLKYLKCLDSKGFGVPTA